MTQKAKKTDNQRKTKSALKNPRIAIAVAALLFGIAAFSLWGLYDMHFTGNGNEAADSVEESSLRTACLKINPEAEKCDVKLEVADTDSTRTKGLSGRESMEADEGMLFVSDMAEVQCFWMKGMLIPLDMIWLNDAKEVSKVEANISPETYPTQFCSPQPDKYVIELTAGSAERFGIKVGDTLTF